MVYHIFCILSGAERVRHLVCPLFNCAKYIVRYPGKRRSPSVIVLIIYIWIYRGTGWKGIRSICLEL